jgi:hypothetical protein
MRGTTKWWSPYDREKEGAIHIYLGGAVIVKVNF